MCVCLQACARLRREKKKEKLITIILSENRRHGTAYDTLCYCQRWSAWPLFISLSMVIFFGFFLLFLSTTFKNTIDNNDNDIIIIFIIIIIYWRLLNLCHTMRECTLVHTAHTHTIQSSEFQTLYSIVFVAMHSLLLRSAKSTGIE